MPARGAASQSSPYVLVLGEEGGGGGGVIQKKSIVSDGEKKSITYEIRFWESGGQIIQSCSINMLRSGGRRGQEGRVNGVGMNKTRPYIRMPKSRVGGQGQ